MERTAGNADETVYADRACRAGRDGKSYKPEPRRSERKERPMRVIRTLVATAGLLAAMPALALAQMKVDYVLKEFYPTQPLVEYDILTDKAAIDACKLETLNRPDGKYLGFAVRDGQGKLLRKFLDTNGKKDADGKTHLDQWSYYQNGFEVYREIDLDEDGRLDEIRWMNAGGTRIATVKKGKIVAWKRISAEEASRVLVQAVLASDVELLETVMATARELESIGAPKSLVDKTAQDVTQRTGELAKLRKDLVGWTKQTAWQRFDGTMPHVIPAEAGLKDDLTLYENAFIFAGAADGQGDPMSMAYLQVPELIRVGDAWKFVELPRAINPKAPPEAVAEAGLRSALYRETDAPGAPAEDPALAAALQKLAAFDQKNAPDATATKRQIAEFHYGRLTVLRDVVSAAKRDEDRLNYNKQVIDSISAAYQTGEYAKGVGMLDQFAAKPGKLGSYAAYRKIGAQYALDADQPNNELPAQKAFLTALQGFLTKYPDAEETPDVLLNLATGREFNAEEDEARKAYTTLARDYATTPAGKKAAGALRRLDLVGKAFDVTGPDLHGKKLNTASYRGKPLLVVFWSDTDTVRHDLPALKKVCEKYAAKGLEVIGIGLDETREATEAFLKDNGLTWPQIYETGGMDSRLADEFGIISQPTMFLVDKEGKVVNQSLHTAASLERFLGKLLAEN
jgi:peroxiredoxin